MKDCDIYSEETVGIVKPKTYGGHNGDLSRIWFQRDLDIRDELVRRWKYMAKQLRVERNITIYRPKRRRYNDSKRRN